jgi:hypothetical protein
VIFFKPLEYADVGEAHGSAAFKDEADDGSSGGDD